MGTKENSEPRTREEFILKCWEAGDKKTVKEAIALLSPLEAFEYWVKIGEMKYLQIIGEDASNEETTYTKEDEELGVFARFFNK